MIEVNFRSRDTAHLARLATKRELRYGPEAWIVAGLARPLTQIKDLTMKLLILAVATAFAGSALADVSPPVTMQPIPNPPAKSKVHHAKAASAHKAAKPAAKS